MLHSPENAERRRGAIAALCELLRQGLDVETSCRVQDWPCFLSQALNRLMATEIVDLLPWDEFSHPHVALGFSSKKTELVNKAKTICECLMASESIDLKFEEAFCLFLLGQGKQDQAEMEIKDGSSAKPSLEIWLKDSVLAIFSDTRDCSPSLVSFFGGERRAIASKKSRMAAQATAPVSHRPLSDIAMKQMDAGETIPCMNSSQHFRSAENQLAPTDLQSSLILTKNDSGSSANEPSVQLKRDLGAHNRGTWESWIERGDLAGKIVFTLFIVVKVVFLGRVINLLSMIKVQFGNRSDTKILQGSGLAASISSSIATISRKQMPVEEAEALVKHWQAIKAEALGPGHQVHSLSEVLDESMLAQWQALADAAKSQSSYWRFVLLQLSILQAHIFSDGYGVEIAEIKALLEEAAELVDESPQKNPNYYSTYKILYVLKKAR
ncbi:PLASTID DIVISION PROTEIN CDP1 CHLOROPLASTIC-RELATED [Salix purpurea]|uniref:PLASTID DIVISION PROTEIN CDP1 CHLOROPLASTIC-RELATED n=1 Tax=Salix purpurea TaxID=77065 RepID=A0A9Q0VHR3_SALPP|nr:PLASTID DIVISION PROTEIN CDP1 CHLOROPLASTIC-RELATED [Salix purpurea]